MASEYKSAGVDVDSGYKSVEMIKESVRSTYRKEVLGDLGGFGGMFSLKSFKSMSEPILVSGTDGVGTKLKIAFLLDKHDKIGIDCVAMCVNDILCSGAQPLFFLDYIATDKINPEQIADIVKGIAEGCRQAGCALIGGETAEMPGFYHKGEYDLAGFCVGIVNKPKMIDMSNVSAGNAVIGIASSGLHSNGYSLVRKVLRPSVSNIDEYILSLGSTLGDAIFKPTKIYVNPVLELLRSVNVKGISNITGGGFIENIPRMIPNHLGVKINEGSWDILPIFTYIEHSGNIEHASMYNIFNMGIGMTLAVDKEDAEKTIEILSRLGEKAYIIGEVTETPGIEICCV